MYIHAYIYMLGLSVDVVYVSMLRMIHKQLVALFICLFDMLFHDVPDLHLSAVLILLLLLTLTLMY